MLATRSYISTGPIDGTVCDDFVCSQGNGRSVTITADPTISEIVFEEDEGDGWADVRVPGEFLTVPNVREALAVVNGCHEEKIVVQPSGN